MATSRNEGINKVVKRGLSLKSNFLKVVQTVHARLEAQDTKTGFADMKASIDFTGFNALCQAWDYLTQWKAPPKYNSGSSLSVVARLG